MAYEKQTWSSNELITAEKLNHIENGIPTKTSQLTNDSGFLTSHQSIAKKKNIQSAVSSPDSTGTAVAFIDTITQDSQGVITPTKKSVRIVTETAVGLMSINDKKKLDGIAAGAQVNSVTSVNNKTGAVALGAGDVGAVNKTGDTMSGNLKVVREGNATAGLEADHSTTEVNLYMMNEASGVHGLRSSGYFNGSSLVSNPIWMIQRGTDGDVIVADHYSIDEINAILGPTDISEDFTKGKADTLIAVKTGKIVTVYAEINNASGSTLEVCTCGNHSPAVRTLGGVYDYDSGAPVSASAWAQPPNTNNIAIFASSSLSGKIAVSITYIEQ